LHSLKVRAVILVYMQSLTLHCRMLCSSLGCSVFKDPEQVCPDKCRDQALPEDLFSEDTADPGEDETGPAETASELAGAAQTEAAKVNGIIHSVLPACCHARLS